MEALKEAVQFLNTTNRRSCSVSLTTNSVPQSPAGSMSNWSAHCGELRNSLLADVWDAANTFCGDREGASPWLPLKSDTGSIVLPPALTLPEG
jgi:hypothetical protein